MTGVQSHSSWGTGTGVRKGSKRTAIRFWGLKERSREGLREFKEKRAQDLGYRPTLPGGVLRKSPNNVGEKSKFAYEHTNWGRGGEW